MSFIDSGQSTSMIFKLGELLGSGGYGRVYRAFNPTTNMPLPVAIKKSRSSQRLRRPHLQHEARVLHLLQGHSGIPRLVGYAHLYHFEYLAMEVLGKTLEQVTPIHGLEQRVVARVAVDILSALRHVHSHGLVHGDIKPSNILLSLDQQPSLCLTDFGTARPFHSGTLARLDPVEYRHNIIGTLKWCSLNTHYGYDPSPRDDLESLGYTLFHLLRGDLPWKHCISNSGTLFGNMKQVREKKKQWLGLRLARGMAGEFGDFLDYARSLRFDETPDYERWASIFKKLSGNDTGVLNLPPVVKPQPIQFSSWWTGPPPVTVGQLVYVQLHSRFTIEGYSPQASDASHWNDPMFSGPELETNKWPAVVVDVIMRHEQCKVGVLPIRRDVIGRAQEADVVAAVKISPQSHHNGPLSGNWPWDDVVAYGFPVAETFTCIPSQPTVPPGGWSISSAKCKELRKRFDRHIPSPPTSAIEELRGRIAQISERQRYAFFSPIKDPRADEVNAPGTWYNTRGWLDELARIMRRRVLEEAHDWSSSETKMSEIREQDTTEGPFVDSNSNPWMSEYFPLGGRGAIVTFGQDTVWKEKVDSAIPRIERVVKANE